MKYCRVAMLAGAVVLISWIALGCSDVNQLTDPEPAFETLVVAYSNPGPSANPCDDLLPQIDGVIQDQEWALAQPRYVRMTGANGNGGKDFYMEVRAVWTDDGKQGGSDRIFLMVRYQDDDFDSDPDQMAYIQEATSDNRCQNTILIEGKLYCPSPTPVFNPDAVFPEPRFDQVIVDPDSWTRLNPDGREDQVVVLISRVDSPDVQSGLTELNGEVLGLVGPEMPAGKSVNGTNTDVWIWRAGRTNLHPISQYPNWEDEPDLFTGIIEPAWSRFLNNSGFCEDGWIDGGGQLVSDAGLKPFVKNWEKDIPDTDDVDTLLVKLTECPPLGRDLTEEQLKAQNGGVPKDLGLWWPTAKAFRDQDTLACSRVGTVGPWSSRLLPGEFDKVQGWGLQIPYLSSEGNTSGRDVRAKATYEATQEKGFGVLSLEMMRDLNTGQFDDVVIEPDDPVGEYRIVIGVLDRSGKIGSGSTEIRLKFESPKAAEGGPADRC